MNFLSGSKTGQLLLLDNKCWWLSLETVFWEQLGDWFEGKGGCHQLNLPSFRHQEDDCAMYKAKQ